MRLYRQRYRTAAGEMRESPKWWVTYSVKGIRCRRSTGMTEKRAAEQEAARMVRAAERKAAGLDTHEEAQRTPLQELVQEFVRSSRRRRENPKHGQQVERLLRRMLRGRKLASITPAVAERVIATESEGKSARTEAYARWALRSFFAWLVENDHWTRNPVKRADRRREADAKRKRRALTQEEVERLLATAPEERRLLYLVALSTGLRRSELEALAWEDLDLKAKLLKVRAEKAKGKREAVLPLASGTAEALRAVKGRARRMDRVIGTVPRVEVLHRDLVAAGIEPTTADGTVDFHALRVTFGTMLARRGVPLRDAQELLRHRSPLLTAQVYQKLASEDIRGAVESLALAMPEMAKS
jgi:integrase